MTPETSGLVTATAPANSRNSNSSGPVWMVHCIQATPQGSGYGQWDVECVGTSPQRYHTPMPSDAGAIEAAIACNAPGAMEVTIRFSGPSLVCLPGLLSGGEPEIWFFSHVLDVL